jgi:hypothetical protein
VIRGEEDKSILSHNATFPSGNDFFSSQTRTKGHKDERRREDNSLEFIKISTG